MTYTITRCIGDYFIPNETSSTGFRHMRWNYTIDCLGYDGTLCAQIGYSMP